MTTDQQITPVSPDQTSSTAVGRTNFLASSVQRLGVGLKPEVEFKHRRISSDGKVTPGEFRRIGWSVGVSDAEAVAEAIRLVKDHLAAPTEDQIAEWVAELSVITSRRPDAPQIESFRLHAYTKRLIAYPADVVHEALLVRLWRFFPSWAELHEICEELSVPRQQMLSALQQARS